MGIPRENIFVLEDGDILELGEELGKVTGKVPSDDIYVSGVVMGDLDSAVLQERKLLSWDGVVVVTLAIDTQKRRLVGTPQIVTRGFVGLRENQALIEKSQDMVMAVLSHDGKHLFERRAIETRVRNSLAKFLYEQTHRRPIIFPVVVEV
jgi:ribonuclease J